MITRHNYEEFFLLYVDNELSAADRQTVESFVAENPDLRTELNVLMQCRLVPERNVFQDKGSLLRPLATEVPRLPLAERPYAGHLPEGSLHLYIDGELDAEASRAVERQAQEDPSVNRELLLLRQTISEPDAGIIFAQKEKLYKKEEERKIALMSMFRIAAAALLLLLAGLAVLYVMRKKEGAATAGASGKKAQPSVAHSGKNADRAVTRNPVPALYPLAGGQQNSKGAQEGRPTRVSASRVERRKEGAGMDNELANNQQSSNRAVVLMPVNAGTEKTINEGVDVAVKKGNSVVAVARIDADRAGHPLPGPTVDAGTVKGGTFATDALLREGTAYAAPGDMAGGDDGGDATPSKKRKLRGVLRTVSRVFERTTSQSDGDRPGILIGNLQIALK